MHLYLMRHGEACAINHDFNQALTSKGQNDITALAKFLSLRQISIDHIIHIDKHRAKQTAEILLQMISVPKITELRGLLTDPSALNELISLINEFTDDTLIVGHLPLLDRLIQCLLLAEPKVSALINFQPGTIVSLTSCSHSNWIINWVIDPCLVL